MHRDNRQQEPNLMDPEDREAFLYDAELTLKLKLTVSYLMIYHEDNQEPYRYLTKKGYGLGCVTISHLNIKVNTRMSLHSMVLLWKYVVDPPIHPLLHRTSTGQEQDTACTSP
jgi:hypothetical protein